LQHISSVSTVALVLLLLGLVGFLLHKLSDWTAEALLLEEPDEA
jgi:preprotein translocase subunit Sss1